MTADDHWALFRADPRATPFQSPAWLEAWWAHLGGGERIDLAVPGAALPMFVWQDGGVRRLVPVGAGHSDYCDALIDPASPGALDRLWTALFETADRWDEVLLPDLRSDSPLLGRLPEGWIATDTPGEICPVMPLPDAPPLLAAMPKAKRRKVVHDRNRAAALGDVTEALIGPDDLDIALDGLFDLHARRWARQGEAGVLADPRVQAFHRAAAPALMAAGLLRVSVVRHRDRIVAVLLGFADRRRGYSYINGVDQETPGQSFGTLAFACMMEDALAGGAREFHFLRGQEAYKYQWGAIDTSTVRRTIRRA